MDLMKFTETVYIPSRINLSESAAEQIIIAVRLINRWREKPVDTAELTADLVNAFLRSLALLGRSATTINGKRGSLLSVWRIACKRGLAGPLPDSEDCPKKREPKRIPRAWTVEEMGKILSVCQSLTGRCKNNGIRRSDFWASTVLFQYDTGSRLGAALSVRTSDVDLSNCRVLLRAEEAKTDTEQLVTISPQTAESIKRHVTPNREFVWPWSQNHRALWTYLKKILEQAGLPSDRQSMFHRFRRTNATWTAVSGSLDMAQHGLGHTSQEMTLRSYIDPTLFRQKQPSEILPRPVAEKFTLRIAR